MIDNNLQIVAIVGRPNVGKSSLFNRLLSRAVAITNEQSGTTRDRHYEAMDWNGRKFLLVDTGGMESNSPDELTKFIRRQAEMAVKEADVVLFLVDAHTGPTQEDHEIARGLSRIRDKVVIAANKTDSDSFEEQLYEFLQLGLGEAVPVSAEHGRGTGDLLDILTLRLKDNPEPVQTAKETVRVALVGRPNVGKSTLVNHLLGENRMATDNRPGTTRDAVDTYLTYNNRNFCLVDTAGLRKRSHVSEPIELISTLHTQRGIERSDVVALLIDAEQGCEEQDLKIVEMVMEKGRGLVVVFNKWDKIERETETFDKFVKAAGALAPFLAQVPYVAASALTGQRAWKVLEQAAEVHDRLDVNVAPQDLKSFLEETVARHPHPSIRGRFVTFHSMFQTGNKPPTFEIKSNTPDKVRPSYLRFLLSSFHERFPFQGVPVRINFSFRKRGD